MIDLKRYYRLHPKKLCWVEKKDEETLVVYFKRFDNETGEEISPEPQYTNLSFLEKDKEEFTIQLDALNSIIEDAKKLLQ